MERSRRRELSSIEELEVTLERSTATSNDNSSETIRPIFNLIEDRKSTRSRWRGGSRSPEGQSTSSRRTETGRSLTTARTMNQTPPTPNNPNNQITVSYKTIVLACSVLVGFLATVIALSMQLYHQGQHFEIEKRQLGDVIEQCRVKSSKIDELREKVTQLKSANKEFEIRTEYLKKENKEFKDQNLVLNQEVVELREALTHSKYQLNLTVADLKMQHQDQLHKQRQEDQSQMESRVQEMAKTYNKEMEIMFRFISCLTEDDSIPILGVFQRMFSALIGNSNVDRCRHLIPGRTQYHLT